MTIGLAAWLVIANAIRASRVDIMDYLLRRPTDIFAIVDPWSVLLLGTLAWGVWRGLRRWESDGGWLLGLAAVGVTGLGGLWLAWWSTNEPVIQPIALAVPFLLLGSLGGIVIGQGWRSNASARHDRWWVTFAVLGHGVVIAGFGYLAETSLFDPFGGSPWSLLLLIPLAVIALAFHRWLGGGQRWLIFFDLIVASIGLLGLWLWTGLGSSSIGRTTDIGQVGVMLAVAASIVALVTSFHSMPRAEQPSGGSAGPASLVPQVEATVLNAVEPPGGAPPTT